MLVLDRSAVATASPYPELLVALASGLQLPIESPMRSAFAPNHDDSTVLIMPAWKRGDVMGVKLVSIWPGNHALDKSAVSGVYVLISCKDGNPVAVMDGTELTLRRTAATAALGARMLARKDSRTLVILGTGSLALPMALAHAAAMPWDRILVWGRNLAKAQRVVEALAALGVGAQAHGDLQAVLAQADVVVAATTATEPFVRSAWVRPGTHLGLIGAFTPAMAEAEPTLMARSQVFVDSRESILHKGGEVLQAIQQGLMQATDIVAELAEMVAHPDKAWRQHPQSITVFKSVGFASLDLITAELILGRQALV